jgi:hypothetical protein
MPVRSRGMVRNAVVAACVVVFVVDVQLLLLVALIVAGAVLGWLGSAVCSYLGSERGS